MDSTNNAAAVCVACHECGRGYSSPLDLPPVLITAVVDITSDKIERDQGYCYPSNGQTQFAYFLKQLSAPDQDQIRNICASLEVGKHSVAVTTAAGENAVCRVEIPCNFPERTVIRLIVDVLPRISAAVDAAKMANPLVVGAEPVSVRAAWSAIHLKRVCVGFSEAAWLRHLSDDIKGYYLGIGDLKFATSSTGSFVLKLYGDGPNMGSAGGPTFEPLATLYRVDFRLAPARN